MAQQAPEPVVQAPPEVVQVPQEVQAPQEVQVSFTTLKAQLLVKAAKVSEAVEFYKAAFGAVETDSTRNTKRKAEQELPNPLIASADLQLAGTTILITRMANESEPVGNGPVSLCLETLDLEAAVAKAVAAGAVAAEEITVSNRSCDADRWAMVTDPFGFVWRICTPIKNGS